LAAQVIREAELAAETERYERQYRVEDAFYNFEYAEKNYFDSVNEVELYKELVAAIDKSSDPRLYHEYETAQREAQMRIADLENTYEELENEYTTLVRKNTRLD
jgi:cephalosporin hydroxylase